MTVNEDPAPGPVAATKTEYPSGWLFILLWVGQVVSLIGTQLTGFSLGVWALQETGAVTIYGLFAVATITPTVLASPVVGVFLDRMPRRLALLAGHAGAGVFSLIIAGLYLADALAVWAMLLMVTAASFCNAVQLPGFAAVTTKLVHPRQLGRANGMVQLGFALAWIIAPAIAGFLLPKIALTGILLIDVTTFTFAISVLAVSRIPEPERVLGGGSRATLLRDALYGWRYLIKRPGLMGLVLFLAAINFNIGAVNVLIAPLVLSFADEATLGLILSIGGSGMLLGSLFVVAWGGPRRHRVWVILGCIASQGVLFFLGATKPTASTVELSFLGEDYKIPALLALAAFGVLATLPIVAAYSEVIWMRKVRPAVQGRVFAFKGALVGVAVPVASIIAGPLADKVFGPAMDEGGWLAPVFGPYLGVGPGRGVALMFVGMGVITLASAAIGLYPKVRRLERDLPDYDDLEAEVTQEIDRALA